MLLSTPGLGGLMPALGRGSSDMRRVVVVGGGVSGLGFAHEALRLRPNLELTVLEADTRVGGLVRTETLAPGVRVEFGPDSMAMPSEKSDALLTSLALEGALMRGGSAPRRAYVGRDARLQELPRSLMSATADSVELARSRLFRASTKLRMAAEPFVKRGDSVDGESAADFLARRFGRGFVEDAMGPLLSAIYHAPLDELGACEVLSRFVALERAHGSISKGLREASATPAEAQPAFVSLRDGMEQLPRAIAGTLGHRVRVCQTVERIRAQDRGYRIELRDGGVIDADLVVLAVPPSVAARLLGDVAKEAAQELTRVRSAPIETVSLLYEQCEAPPLLDGTGFVLARGGARVLSSLTWANRKWDHRAPADRELLRCSVRGEGRDDAELLAELRRDLRDWLGEAGKPSVVVFDRRRVALPIHGVGHIAAMQRMKAALETQPGLAVIGNGVDAIGVADCLRRAATLARSMTVESNATA